MMAGKPLRTREQWVRRAARRQGVEVYKSRQRDPRGVLHGRWWILVPGQHVIGGGIVGNPPGLSLDEVEQYLRGDDSVGR